MGNRHRGPVAPLRGWAGFVGAPQHVDVCSGHGRAKRVGGGAETACAPGTVVVGVRVTATEGPWRPCVAGRGSWGPPNTSMFGAHADESNPSRGGHPNGNRGKGVVCVGDYTRPRCGGALTLPVHVGMRI